MKEVAIPVQHVYNVPLRILDLAAPGLFRLPEVRTYKILESASPAGGALMGLYGDESCMCPMCTATDMPEEFEEPFFGSSYAYRLRLVWEELLGPQQDPDFIPF